MTVSEDDVRRVAKLARLELTEEEIRQLTPQVASIINFVDHLTELDTDQIPPLTQAIESYNVFAEDELKPGLARDEALANAPKRDEECFLVPPVLGGAANS